MQCTCERRQQSVAYFTISIGGAPRATVPLNTLRGTHRQRFNIIGDHAVPPSGDTASSLHFQGPAYPPGRCLSDESSLLPKPAPRVVPIDDSDFSIGRCHHCILSNLPRRRLQVIALSLPLGRMTNEIICGKRHWTSGPLATIQTSGVMTTPIRFGPHFRILSVLFQNIPSHHR